MAMRGKGYSYLCSIQKVLLDNILDPNTDKRLLAGMATAYERLDERKRIMRMQPRPRDLDVSRTVGERITKREPAFREPS